MRAAVYRRYGPPDVVTITDAPTPRPGDHEVLVRVHAASVGSTDSTARRGQPAFARLFTGLRHPRHPILGSEFAGEVETVGAGVTRFRPGDAVFGATGPALGSHAEYVCLRDDAALAPKPAELDDAESAAIIDGVLTALPFLRDAARLRPGQSVLVIGASGCVGSAAVQLAKHMGAEVTAVCSGSNRELVAGLGADHVIDYATEDVTRAGRSYDVIFDAATASSFARCRGILNPGGVYLATVPSLTLLAQMAWTSRFGRRRAAIRFTGLRAPADRAKDLTVLTQLVVAGSIVPVIEERFPFERITEAHARVDTGHKKGNVVVTLAA